jgi:REP element-mobilizing transposase RayT
LSIRLFSRDAQRSAPENWSMILGAHVIFGAYGFWLPNDPRGSWSTFIGSYELYHYGPATKTDERRSLAHNPHDRQLRLAAKSALQRPAVMFGDAQIRAVGEGFGKYVQKSDLQVWACAVLRNHVHLVIASRPMKIENRVIQLKACATTELLQCGLHPFQNDRDDGKLPKCFVRGEWKVYLNHPVDVERAIHYVEANPAKEGLLRQTWPFVTTWRGLGEPSAARRG